MTQARLDGHFLSGLSGPVFVLRRGPKPARACVLVAAPFAEEMNKSRRMVTLVASQLAQQGVAVVMPDYFGTGDSAGDFADATIPIWRDDLTRTAQWCSEAVGPVRGLLAVRLGCAFIADEKVLASLPELRRSVMWQPVFDGARHVTQFLRLRVAASMANGVSESPAELRRLATALGAVEIAGYRITSRLLQELEELSSPTRLPSALGEIGWFELVRDPEAGLPVPSRKLIEATRAAGGLITEHALAGEPFWVSTEITTNQSLVVASVRALAEACTGERTAE